MTAPHNDDPYEPDLDVCPGCGGPADNGFDRCMPPNPYFCSACQTKADDFRVRSEILADDLRAYAEIAEDGWSASLEEVAKLTAILDDMSLASIAKDNHVAVTEQELVAERIAHKGLIRTADQLRSSIRALLGILDGIKVGGDHPQPLSECLTRKDRKAVRKARELIS